MFRKFFFFCLLALLLILSWFVYKKVSKPSVIDKEGRDFAVRDTASITRILLSDKEGNHSELLRTDSGWVVNHKYPVRSDAILILLEAIKRVEVFSRVPLTMEKTIFRTLSHNAIKVEIFSGKKKIKKYYVGGETQDGQGSYMLLSYPDEENKNYERPYVVGIPGFVGFLGPRYITRPEWWRSTEIIHYQPGEIVKLEMINHQYPDSSFTLVKNNNSFKLLDSRNIEQSALAFKTKQYLAYFTSLHVEMYFTNEDKFIADSLRIKGKPFCTVKIQDAKGNKKEFLFYRRPVEATKSDEFKAYYSYDPERCFLWYKSNRSNEFAYVQYFVFGKLFVNPQYFLKE
jgi:hypothetical protein